MDYYVDVHTLFSILGLVPGLGLFFDVANGILYAEEGDIPNAVLSYASAFIDLGVMVVVNGTRLAVKAFKYIDDIPQAAKVVNTVTGEVKTGKELAEALIKGGDEVVEGVDSAKFLDDLINRIVDNKFKYLDEDYIAKMPSTTAEYMRQEALAESMYDAFRNTSDDIAIISKNTGLSIDDVTKIKNHMFIDELLLDSGLSKLDPDYEMANAWQRLIDGNYYKNDALLLQHELYESIYYKLYNCTQREAHNATSIIFDWASTIYE